MDYRGLANSAKVRRIVEPRLTKYIPNRPTPKQLLALSLPHREVFFGGAAGGGKSDWLLMCALQYVDIPDYHALVIRKTLADASNPGSIMFRANQWLTGTDAKQRDGIWFFPSGATLSFAGLDKRGDEFKQQGAEYSCVCVDELTQLKPHQFEYVIGSRLRKPGCSLHKDARDPECKYCQRYMHTNLFPLRVRTASNPGGHSHLYVKKRYDIRKVPGAVGPSGLQLYAGRNSDRPHIPAFIDDNPFLDREDYISQLAMMSTDPVTRRQLLAGDWGVSADGLFEIGWARRYRIHAGRVYVSGHPEYVDRADCEEFLIVDTASTSDSPPSGTSTRKSRDKASWTVVSRWLGAYFRTGYYLCLLDIQRDRCSMPGISDMIYNAQMGQRTDFVGMEYTTQSIHLYQHLQSEGFNMKPFVTGGKDKVARSVSAANMMEQGLLQLPEAASWLEAYEDEVFTWTGDDEETDDQVDVTSYAGIYAANRARHYDDKIDAEDIAFTM